MFTSVYTIHILHSTMYTDRYGPVISDSLVCIYDIMFKSLLENTDFWLTCTFFLKNEKKSTCLWRISNKIMSALFNFQSLLTVILLLICTCAYVRSLWPSLLDRRKTGPLGTFWKCARIGERLSPYVAIGCIMMALHSLFISD